MIVEQSTLPYLRTSRFTPAVSTPMRTWSSTPMLLA